MDARPVLSMRQQATGLLLVVSLLLGVSIGFAPAASAQTELEVEAGFGGFHEFGADLVIRVRVETDRLVNGTLQAFPSAPFGSFPVVQAPVEAAGGTTKEFLLVFPSFQEWGGGIQVDLIEDGVATATALAQVRGLTEGELVGVLPGISAELEGVTSLSVPLGNARSFPIDQRWLDAGAGAIDALSSIVATNADLQTLSPGGADVIGQWIFSGGTLIVDEPAGLIASLGITAADTPTAVGHGVVMTTAWARSQGDSDTLLAPTARRMTMNNPFPEMTGDMPWFGGQLASELADDAGFGLPALGWVLGLLGLYIVLVGPLLWFVLRRIGKPRLLWTALPVLALVFTAGVWGVGSAIRSSTTSSHGTIIEIANGQAHTTSTILALSRNGGPVSLNLPEQWRIAPAEYNFGPSPSDGPTTRVRTGAGRNRIDVDLAAGQFTTMSGRGPADAYVNGVSAAASAPTNGAVSGSVTNNLSVELHEVVVFAGADGVNIGSIGPDVTVPFTFTAAGRDRFGEPVEMRLWQNAMNGRFGPFGEPLASNVEAKINISLWANYITENLGRSRPLGEVTIAGWTNDLPSTMDSSVESGRTLVVASAPIETQRGVLTDVANRRTVLRSPTQLDGGQPNFGAGFVLGSAWRFDVPADVDATTVGLHLPNQISKVELWVGNEWRTFEDTTSGLYSLPPEAIRNGSLTAKIFIDFDRGPTTLGPSLALRTITDADTPLDDFVSGNSGEQP